MLRETLTQIANGAEFDFDEIAIEVFAYQYERSPAYKIFCDEQGVTPKTATDWRAIPLMPIDALKETRVYCGEGEPLAYLETSGTTAGTAHRGKHYFESFDLFDAAIPGTFKSNVLDVLGRQNLEMLTLTSPVDLAPHAAYARCVSRIVHAHGTHSRSFVGENGIDYPRFGEALRSATNPVFLIGSTFAFVHVVENGCAAKLPPGSALMHAGGYKGRCREMPYDEYEAFVKNAFGIEQVFNMYSMTEMSSQFYGGEWVKGPPWVKTRILDVETLRDVPAGQSGHVAIVDLLNLDACAFFVTKDLGIEREDGSLRVIGRIPGAEYQTRLDAFVRGAKQVWSC